MRKFLAFFLFIFLISSISAVSIEIKDSYSLGENFIAKISGKFFVPLTLENIRFYRGNFQSSFGIPKLEKIDGDYYLYLQVPLDKIEDNYSLKLSNIEYYSEGEVVKGDILKDFSVSSAKAPFSIEPIYQNTESDYTLNFNSLSNEVLNISYFKNEIKEHFLLESNEDLEITFSELGLQKGLNEIDFYSGNNSYPILIYFTGKETIIVEEDLVLENSTNSSTNITNEIIENETTDFEIEEGSNNNFLTCDEMNLTVCKNGFKCNGDLIDSKNDQCCEGECVEIQKSSTGKTIGWLLIISIVLFLTWFFKKKYNGTRRSKIDLEDEAKKDKEKLKP